MTEAVKTLIQWTIKISSMLAVLIVVAVIFSVIFGTVMVGINSSVFGDVLKVINIWMPFHLIKLLQWLLIMAGLVVGFNLTLFSYKFISDVIGGGK